MVVSTADDRTNTTRSLRGEVGRADRFSHIGHAETHQNYIIVIQLEMQMLEAWGHGNVGQDRCVLEVWDVSRGGGTVCSRKRTTRSIEPDLRGQLLHDVVLVQTRENTVRHVQHMRRRIDVYDDDVIETSNSFPQARW